MRRMLWVACSGLLAGVLSAASPAQDPPLFIPNDSWDGLPVIGDPGRAEREFKFTIDGDGLSDFNNALLATQIQLALAAAIGTVPWQAPPLVGFPLPPSPYQLGAPSNPVFLDIYYDSQEGLNYLSDSAYRFRMRFSGVNVIQDLQPQRLEYQSHFDQTPFVDGFRTRTESRLELARNQSIFGSLDAFVRNAQSGLFESHVMAPSFGLVDFYRRRTQQEPRLVYLPNLVLETDRGRVHFMMDLTNLKIGVGVKEVFLVTMDTSRVYLAANYLQWLSREVPVKPEPLTVLNEVEVEFDRGASVPLDQAIAQAQSLGDKARLLQLTQVLNAFLADQRTVMDTLLARFAEISREIGDANYLVSRPGVNSKYRQAFEIVLGSFTPARMSVRGAPTSEGFEITVTGDIGRSYRLQACSDFPATNWEDISQFTLTQPTTNLVDTTATKFPRRFYRAVSP